MTLQKVRTADPHEEFLHYVSSLPKLFEQLLIRLPEPVSLKALPKSGGVYALWTGDVPEHVGRTGNLQRRLRGHHSISHYSASLVFKLTRKTTGRVATYTKVGSRQQLMKDPEFYHEFERQRARVKVMSVSFSEIEKPELQYLLELYAAMRLGTSLSEFENH